MKKLTMPSQAGKPPKASAAISGRLFRAIIQAGPLPTSRLALRDKPRPTKVPHKPFKLSVY